MRGGAVHVAQGPQRRCGRFEPYFASHEQVGLLVANICQPGWQLEVHHACWRGVGHRISSASLLAKLPMVRPLSKVMAKYACDLDRAVCFLCNAPG